MSHFPLFFDLVGRRVAVIGGGEWAVRKLRLLVPHAPAIDLYAPDASPAVLALAAAHPAIRLHRHRPEAAALADAAFILVAEEQADRRAAAAALAHASGRPVNVVDDPARSTVLMPAIIDRSPILIAIGTGGAAPLLARTLRNRLEALLPKHLGRLAGLLDRVRARLRRLIPDPDHRRQALDRALTAAEALPPDHWAGLADSPDDLDSFANRCANPDSAVPGFGRVALVGVGPGDPDLLTIRAHRLLGQADIALYDELVPEPILNLLRRDATRLYVGKKGGGPFTAQEEINRLLLEHARAGRLVVRLKSGDPFVFGRGGEERDHLIAAGIAVEVVPGITAALGCAASAGIPLTHRDYASALTLMTGHGREAGGQEGEPFSGLTPTPPDRGTLVVYMGRRNAARLTGQLYRAGYRPDIPVAFVTNGTRPDQVVTTGYLADLPHLAATTPDGPSLLFIGEAVRRAPAWASASAVPPSFAAAAE